MLFSPCLFFNAKKLIMQAIKIRIVSVQGLGVGHYKIKIARFFRYVMVTLPCVCYVLFFSSAHLPLDFTGGRSAGSFFYKLRAWL